LGRESPQATAAGVDPGELQQLLQSCLAAVVAPLPTQPWQQQGIRGLQQQQQQQQEVVTSRLEQQRKRSKQGQPWQLPDYVRPELADSMVRLLKRKGGVVVAQPQTLSGKDQRPRSTGQLC
jgi:cysteinyl-tRNA synthetase